MVQESRSLLIQQLFRGGFKEDDDDDEDEDEAHELMKRHPSGSSDERQGFGCKVHTHQKELRDGDSEASRLNNKGSKDEKQVVLDYDSNAVNRHKLLPRKDSQAELQEDCLQPEKDIIEEGSKKLLQIHSEFLVRQCNPPLQPIKEPAQQEPETTPDDSHCLSKNCHQQLQGGLNPSLAFTPPKLASKTKEEFTNDHVGMVLGEAQPSVEDALLSTLRDFTSPVSPEEERKQLCFAVLKNAKVAAREVNAKISIPIFSRGFEKKSSISGCTESLASDRGSSTDSVNGGDEVIQDVTSAEKFDEQNGDQFNVQLRSSVDERSTGEATLCIKSRVEEIFHQVENVPAIQLDTANPGSETTDMRIETTTEHKRAGNQIPLPYVVEDNHVEFLSKVHEPAVEFKSSVFEQSPAKVVDKISTVLDSSNVAVEESPSAGARSCSKMSMSARKHSALFVHLDFSEEGKKEVENYKIAPSKKVECPVSTALHCFAVSHGAAEPASLGRAEPTGEAGSAKFGKDIVNAGGVTKFLVNEIGSVKKELQQQDVLSASDNSTCHSEETRRTEFLLKQCADAASLRTCFSEEVNREDDPVLAVDSSKDGKSLEKIVADDIFMASPKEQLADTVFPENETVMCTSSDRKLKSPKSSPNEGPSSTTHRRSLTVEPSEAVMILNPTASSTQAAQTPMKVTSPMTESLPRMPTNLEAFSSLPAAAAPLNKRCCKSEKPHGASSKKSKKSKTKNKKACQDARTMVFVRNDTRVAYNNGPSFANTGDHNLQAQENAMANVMNPGSLFDFGAPQGTSHAAAFMRHETDVHLMQAQTSAKDAMVAATSALSQSHCEWTRMQTQAAHSRLIVMRESQIAAIAASVAAAAVVAKAAVEAARAIQEASKEFLAQFGGPSQPIFGNSGFSRSAEMLAHGQGTVSDMTTRQPAQFTKPTKINTADRKGKNMRSKPGASSAIAKDELVRDKTGRFMRQEVIMDDQKRVVNREKGEGDQKKRTFHEMKHGVCSSHAELRDPDDGVFTCTQGAATGDQPDELVEVMTEEVGLQGGWFVAKVLMKTDKEAFVQYNELFRDDGCTPRRNLFPLSSFREEGIHGRTQKGDQQWLRPLHPFSKAQKLCCSSMLPQTWAVRNHVDAYNNGGWWEGTIVEIDKADETNIKIRFPGEKGIQVVKAWDVRPSMIWAGDDWRPWKENSVEEDEPCSKRVKLDVVDNGQTKLSEEPMIKKERMQPLKKLVEEPCKPISNAPVGPRVGRRSSEAAARKNSSSGNNTSSRAMTALTNTKRVGFTVPTDLGHKATRPEGPEGKTNSGT